MKITGIGICPPPGAKDNPSVTPELLASCLARYSRSNKGIETILASVDWNDPEKSVDAIFRFVDYGHASITGMSGGIAIAIDGCSMYLAYKLFEIAQLCDGQESSTRYIKLDKSNLSDPASIGIPDNLIPDWMEMMDLSFKIYHDTYSQLDALAQDNPSVVRVPKNADQKIIDRLRKNYALDRARYFIPFATRTNAAYVMTARVWADTVKLLDSVPLPEAHECADGIRKELAKFIPRMMRHSKPDEASLLQAAHAVDYVAEYIKHNELSLSQLEDKFYLRTDTSCPEFFPQLTTAGQSFDGKINRYSCTGSTIKRMQVKAAWNNMAIAELRDLNRHRSGFRFSSLLPVGFYLPNEVSHPAVHELLEKKKALIKKLISTEDSKAAYVYALLLGTQVPFEHSTHADKFIYEIELRTGMGAHFRYAEHLTAAYRELIKQIPELGPYIQLGTAEPE